MPREATGTIERRNGKLRMGITVLTAEGRKRAWINLNPSYTDAQARAWAAKFAEQSQGKVFTAEEIARLKGVDPKHHFETVRQFFENVYTREVELHRYQLTHWRYHILPILGSCDVKTFDQAPLRKLVAYLDASVKAKKLQATTTRVIWAVVRKFTRDLAMSKNDKLRIRKDNPAATVEGPDTGHDRAKQWLYPAELSRFLAAETTPLEIARYVAVQVYLCCRPGEAFGLEWRHVDLETGIIRIEQTRHPETRVVGPTKGRDTRVFPAPACLLPVLRAMRAEADLERSDYLFPFSHRGDDLRGLLQAAGVTRRELHETTDKARGIRMHDCRATGISYFALAGATDDEVRERAGHAAFKTTVGYIRRGKLAVGALGNPFDALPLRLLKRPGSVPTDRLELQNTELAGIQPGYGQAACGSETAGFDPGSPLSVGLSGGGDSSGDDSFDDWLLAVGEHCARAAEAQLLFGGRSGGDA